MDWMGIAGVAFVVVVVGAGWLAVGRLYAAAGRRGERQHRLRQQRKALDAHHTARYAGTPEAFARGWLAWPLAAGAGFAVCGGQAVDTLGDDDPAAVEGSLREWWGIASRADLVEQVWSLLVRGHRTRFAAERAHWLTLSSADARAERRQASALGDGELLARIERVRADERGIGGVDFVAWDLVRAIMLLRSGAAVGYVDEQLAGDTMLLAAERLQQAYGSWQELGQHYELGRWHWRGERSKDDRLAVEHDVHREEAMARPGQPRALVPFDARLPRSERLIVRAAAFEGVEEGAPAIGDWEGRLQAELRAHREAWREPGTGTGR